MNLQLPAVAAELPPEHALTLRGDARYEWVNGQLRERPAMGARANRVATIVAGRLEGHAHAHKLGAIFTQDCGYQIFRNEPRKVRKPDVSFVARGRLPKDGIPDGHMTIPPDLEVEVVSPNDLAEEVDARVADYLGAGVKPM